MNKLEELINDHFGKQPVEVAFGMVEMKLFILSLNLPVKFAEWCMTYYEVQFIGDTTLWRKGDSRSFPTGISYGALYKFWLNNVYDGK